MDHPELAPGEPLFNALSAVVQPKLSALGWTTGDDKTLCEYIVLMMRNGGDEKALAAELGSDLLDLGPNNPETLQFCSWLFEERERLHRQLSSGDQQTGSSANTAAPEPAVAPPEPIAAPPEPMPQPESAAPVPAQDSEMSEAPETESIPTGPKAMRNGNGASGKGKRMLNDLNRQLDRGKENPLNRIRGSSGTGRINSHSSREPPRGPRHQQIGRGVTAMLNGRGRGGAHMGTMNPGMGMQGMQGMPPAMGMPGMPGMPGMTMPPGGLSPEQQMQLFQMYEQSASMMHHLLANPAPTQFVNPNFQPSPQHQNGFGNGHGRGRGNHHGKSMFDRQDKGSKAGSTFNQTPLPPSKKFSKESQDETMADGASTENKTEDANAMEVERPDPANTMCRFNLSCTKADCPFVHQSPAAPPGMQVSIDMNDTCSFGAACKNQKCAGKHPSPAQRDQQKTEVECMFYPNCRDMRSCPYKHPTMPPCRNGADCTVPGCKFFHSKVMCRYNPCTNRYCTYKHSEGQKGVFGDKVWIAPKKDDQMEHVSERKFVDNEDDEEELILPGRTNPETEIET